MNNNIPKDLFELAKHCEIISSYVTAWESGYTSFEVCLRKIQNGLANKCNRLNKEYTLDFDVQILEDLKRLPTPLYSLYDGESERQLSMQRALIKNIVLLSQIKKTLEEQATKKLLVADFLITKNSDGVIDIKYVFPNSELLG